MVKLKPARQALPTLLYLLAPLDHALDEILVSEFPPPCPLCGGLRCCPLCPRIKAGTAICNDCGDSTHALCAENWESSLLLEVVIRDFFVLLLIENARDKCTNTP